jgi:hypothetical protein
VCRTLPLGVLGALRVSGARMPDVRGIDAWQLGAVYRERAT